MNQTIHPIGYAKFDHANFWRELNSELKSKCRKEPRYRMEHVVIGQPIHEKKAAKHFIPEVPNQGNGVHEGWTEQVAGRRIRRLLKVFHGECFYCGYKGPAHHYNRDHLWPASQMGRYRLGLSPVFNVVLSCIRCNTVKGDRPPTADEVERAMNIFWEFYGLNQT